jgi:predicted permease
MTRSAPRSPYGRLAWLFPAPFRRAWSEEMTAVAAALLARARRERGPRAAALLCSRLVLDAVLSGLAERLRGSGPPSRPQRTRSGRKPPMLDALARDLHGAWRSLLHARGHSLAVVLTLALGIGANTAIFSVVRGVLLGAVPFSEPDRLMLLSETNVERGWTEAQVAPANFLDWQARTRSFAGMAAFSDWFAEAVVSGAGEPDRAQTMLVAGDLFGVLGEPPLLGRTFRPEETWGEAGVVMLSHGYWVRRFGGDPDLVGRTIRLNGTPYTVVGVMGERFRFWSADTDLWTPFGWDPQSRAETWFRRAHMLRVIARLAPDATPASAAQELETLAAALEREHPATNTLMRTRVRPLGEWLVGDLRRPLLVLFAAVALVLLIASVNVAHLQLARGAARLRDDAVRGCLGASRWQLLRRAVVEALLLSALGGALGAGLAVLGTRWLVRLGETYLERGGDVTVDGAVLAFAGLLAVVTAVLSGLAPARRASRPELETALRAGGRAGESRAGQHGRQRLVAAELALAGVVLVGSLLLVRTMAELTEVDPGFRAAGVTTVPVGLPGGLYPDDAALTTFYGRFVRGVEAIPGVEAAALTNDLPLTQTSWSSDFAVEGRGREDFGVEVLHREVTPGYFAALGVPVLAGEPFTESHDAAAPPVVVVNQAFVERHFAAESPIGRRLCFDRYPDERSVWRTIVGVVGSERQAALGAPARPEIFAPLAQDTTRGLHLVVRSSLPPATLAPALRAAMDAVDPGLPLSGVRAMDDVVAESLARERFLVVLFGLFAALSVVLASLGVYGVTAEAAAGRRREVGVRIAVGARAGEVVRLMLRRQAPAVAVGVGAGLLGAVGLGHAMRGLLYGVGTGDPASYAMAVAVLLAVGLLSAWLPARQLARVDPLTALREE